MKKQNQHQQECNLSKHQLAANKNTDKVPLQKSVMY